jgi:hypothetical protein
MMIPSLRNNKNAASDSRRKAGDFAKSAVQPKLEPCVLHFLQKVYQRIVVMQNFLIL